MTAAALETIKAAAQKCQFDCQGDVLLAMGGRCLSQVDVNAALTAATTCEACSVGWRVMSVDLWGDLLIIEVRFDPSPSVVSIGPSL